MVCDIVSKNSFISYKKNVIVLSLSVPNYGYK